MVPTRIVLVDMPPMLHDLVSRLIAGTPGLEVVGDLEDERGLEGAVSAGGADVVVAGAEVLDAGPLGRLLVERERLSVLTIDREGRDSRLFTLRRLGEVSPDELVDTIRSAVAAEA